MEQQNIVADIITSTVNAEAIMEGKEMVVIGTVAMGIKAITSITITVIEGQRKMGYFRHLQIQ